MNYKSQKKCKLLSGVSGNQYDLHPMSLGIDPKLLHKFLPLRNSFMRKNGQTDRQTDKQTDKHMTLH